MKRADLVRREHWARDLPVPVRQWVLSLPIPLRLLLAAQPKMVTPVLQVVHRVITGYPIVQAGLPRVRHQTL